MLNFRAHFKVKLSFISGQAKSGAKAITSTSTPFELSNPQLQTSQSPHKRAMLVSLTVGKVDAGVAVLLTEDKRLVSAPPSAAIPSQLTSTLPSQIEFPSVLLPPDITSGSIVDVTVTRNHRAETASESAFQHLQATIFETFGRREPAPPVLRVRNTTQTSVVLEWDAIDPATAECRGLSMYRDGAKIGSIPKPLDTRSTKITGLGIDAEYVFQLVLRTSAGTWSSEKVRVRTHKMTELSGIVVTPGIMPAALKESLQAALERIGAKMIDGVRLDTTHFVCTEGRGQAWEKAVQANVPVVVPDWVLGCEREGRLVGVRAYYLGADPRLRQVGPSTAQQQQQQSQQVAREQHERTSSVPETPTTNVIPPTPERKVERERVNGADEEERGLPAPPLKEDEEHREATLSEEPPTEEEDERAGEGPVSPMEDEERPSPEAEKPMTVLPDRTKATVEDAPEEEASFQDVAL